MDNPIDSCPASEKEPVTCRSSWRLDERPIKLLWHGQRYEVNQIISEWRSPEGHYFLVLAGSDQVFELFYHEYDGTWQVYQK